MEKSENEKGISERMPIEKHDLYSDEKFKQRIVKTNIKHFRTVKGDGNCMYYSIAVSLLDLIRSDENFKKAINKSIEECVELFKRLGIEEFTYADFLSTFHVISDSKNPLEDFSLYDWYEVTGLLRIITSAEMQSNSDNYQPFIPDMEVKAYCKSNVEPFFSAAGYLEIGALVNILPVNVNVIDVYQDDASIRKYGEKDFDVFILHTSNHFEPAYY